MLDSGFGQGFEQSGGAGRVCVEFRSGGFAGCTDSGFPLWRTAAGTGNGFFVGLFSGRTHRVVD